MDFSTPPESPIALESDDPHTKDIFEHVSTLPTLSTESSREHDENYLALATRKLKFDFTTLFTSVRLSLEKLEVTLESVLSHLKSIEAIEPEFETVYIPVSKSETFSKTLSKNHRSLKDLFPAILPYCSWFNHLLVESIINTFCEDDEKLLQKWEKFKGNFAKYCNARLCKCPLEQFGEDQSHADTTPVVMKIDAKWKNVKVTQLEVIRDTIAQILGIKSYNLYLRVVKNGCVELTFHIPNFIATKCLPPSTEQILALQNEGITYILYSNVWALTMGDTASIEETREVVFKGSLKKRIELRENIDKSARKDEPVHAQQELEHEQV